MGFSVWGTEDFRECFCGAAEPDVVSLLRPGIPVR